MFKRFKDNPWNRIAEQKENDPLPQKRLLRCLGQSIRHTRRERKMTQEALSEIAGINAKFLSEFERGKSNITVIFLRKIAGALDLKLSEVFFGCENSSEDHVLYGQISGLLRRLKSSELRKVAEILKVMSAEER